VRGFVLAGVAVLAVGAWIVLALDELRPGAMQGPMDGMSMGAQVARAHHHDLPAPGLGWWMLMTVATMVPATLPMVREISLQSLWTRRYRSAATFLVGYLAVWGVFGAAALGIWGVAGPFAPAATLVIGAILLAAAAWGLTATKRRCLKRCHRYLPLPPRGRAADRACLRFGLYHGSQCLGVCWPLMLVMIPGHSLVLMLGVTALVTWERLARLPRLRAGALVLAIAGAMVVYVAA
jgi:predicted metal-binding membrane protein